MGKGKIFSGGEREEGVIRIILLEDIKLVVCFCVKFIDV